MGESPHSFSISGGVWIYTFSPCIYVGIVLLLCFAREFYDVEFVLMILMLPNTKVDSTIKFKYYNKKFIMPGVCVSLVYVLSYLPYHTLVLHLHAWEKSGCGIN